MIQAVRVRQFHRKYFAGVMRMHRKKERRGSGCSPMRILVGVTLLWAVFQNWLMVWLHVGRWKGKDGQSYRNKARRVRRRWARAARSSFKRVWQSLYKVIRSTSVAMGRKIGIRPGAEDRVGHGEGGRVRRNPTAGKGGRRGRNGRRRQRSK